MTETQCLYVKSLALTASLQESVLPTYFRIDTVVGPSSHLLLNNGILYVYQGRKLIFILMNIRRSYDIVGKHICDAIDAYKLESGCGGTISENNYTTLTNCIIPSWISHFVGSMILP